MNTGSGLFARSMTALSRLVLCCVLVLSSGQILRASLDLDSLAMAINPNPDDTATIKAYIDALEIVRGIDMDRALEWGNNAIRVAEESGDPQLIGHAYNNAGNTYSLTGDYEKALGFYEKAIQVYRDEKMPAEVAKIYMNIGSNYLQIGNYEQAEEWLLKSKSVLEANVGKESSYYAVLYHNLAMVYSSQGKHDEALLYYKESLEMAEEKGDKRAQALAYNNIGFTYQQQGKNGIALENYQKAYRLGKESGRMLETAYISVSLIDGLMLNQQYDEALLMVDTLEDLAAKINAPHLIATAHKGISDVYRDQGKYQSAYEELEKYVRLHDSLLNADQNEKIAAVQNELEIAQKDHDLEFMSREREILDRENSRQRLLLIGLVAALGIAVVAVVLMIMNVRARNAANRELIRYNDLIQEQYEALRQSNERLADLNREKDGLIGIVAHDLKSPLNKSAALTELIASVGPLNAQQEQALNMIRKVTEHGSVLIRDLLDLNSIEHPESELHYEAVDVGLLFSEAAASFEAAVRRKELQIRWEAPQEELVFDVDRNALLRILENLVSNAVKFSPRGKEICVRAEANGNGKVDFSVRDQGPGISAEDRKKLFKKFQRLSARPTGGENSTGLGLAITKTLVEKLKGEIRVESKPGMGAEFIVELPR